MRSGWSKRLQKLKQYKGALRFQAGVICGAANNQLLRLEHADQLRSRGVLYAPDYVVNAGGVISVAHEYLGESSDDAVRAEIERIPERLEQIFEEAERAKQPTNEIADSLARRIVAEAGGSDARRIA